MGKVIVVTSGKGGVGKSTTVVNIGAALALKDKKVLLIDGDTGLRNLDILMGMDDKVVYDFIDVLEGRCRLSQAVIKDKRYDSLYVLPASQTRSGDAVSSEQMTKLCGELRENYDYVLIDCPAGVEQGFVNSAVSADEAIIVTTAERAALRDADRVTDKLEQMGITKRWVIVNRIIPEIMRRKDIPSLGEIIEMLAVDLIGAVPDDRKIIINAAKGEASVKDRKSQAGKAYLNVAERLLGNKVPMMRIKGVKRKGAGL